jgi:hypothetical protein
MIRKSLTKLIRFVWCFFVFFAWGHYEKWKVNAVIEINSNLIYSNQNKTDLLKIFYFTLSKAISFREKYFDSSEKNCGIFKTLLRKSVLKSHFISNFLKWSSHFSDKSTFALLGRTPVFLAFEKFQNRLISLQSYKARQENPHSYASPILCKQFCVCLQRVWSSICSLAKWLNCIISPTFHNWARISSFQIVII